MQQLVADFQHTSWQEAVAASFGIISVLYSRKENILVYPTGIVSTLLYTWLCFKPLQLYAEGSLNFYYTGMSIYGWYVWQRKSSGSTLAISYNSRQEWIQCGVFLLVAMALLYGVLRFYTNSTVPFADSIASATAYVGMWQMARKKVENWIWWIITNAISCPLYFYKGFVLSSVQFVVFFVLAILGLQEWRRKMSNNASMLNDL